MYSKNVGDFDVRINDQRTEEEYTCNILYHQPRTFDTKRRVDYINNELKIEDEEAIEEQRQEIITFRLPLETRTTEEIYEATITTETKQSNRQIEEIRTSKNLDTTFVKNETTGIKRSKTPEQLVEESYEVVSTLTKPRDGNFLVTSSDLSTTKLQQQSSEDDSSYNEEWTVTEAKRKQDGQTVKTIIDR
jgi:hypothetical protein